MIYFMPICDANQMEEQCFAWFPNLPPARQKKMMRYKFAKDRWLCAAAFMLLSYAVNQEHGIHISGHALNETKFGKPYFAEYPEIHFNLSHCDIGVVCIIGETPVGIDIEPIRTPDTHIVRRICSPGEQFLLEHSDNPSASYTMIWTLKESWVKSVGCGFSYSPLNVSVSISVDGTYYIHQNGYDAYVFDIQDSYCISIGRAAPKTHGTEVQNKTANRLLEVSFDQIDRQSYYID